MIEALNLDEVSTSEKFMMMEALWISLTDDVNSDIFTPQWHLNTLKEREKSITMGESTFSSLVDVKERLSKRNHAN